MREISRMVSAKSSKSRTGSEMVIAKREKFLAQREKLIEFRLAQDFVSKIFLIVSHPQTDRVIIR